ncbi:hypothetical protein AB0O32_35350 [Streptomyces rubiginosohelvolus]|uniref:hypothetical protein n=1 Tax=Streptomyces rubiginosohelvolus TaxID=67362 RepID=UPI003438C50C
MLRRATVGAAAVVLVGVLAQAAHADGGKGGGVCDGAALTITVCASDDASTPYTPDRGKSMSPDCGHLYERTAHDKPSGHYRGTATATWAITWTAPALGDEGTLTETRQTAWTARVGEVQIVN